MASATNQDTDEDLQQRLITIIKYLFTKNSKGIFGVPKNFLSTPIHKTCFFFKVISNSVHSFPNSLKVAIL
jgi:hypothetical protein